MILDYSKVRICTINGHHFLASDIIKKYKLVGDYPCVQGNPASGVFTDEAKAKEWAEKLGITYVMIYDRPSIFDNSILY